MNQHKSYLLRRRFKKHQLNQHESTQTEHKSTRNLTSTTINKHESTQIKLNEAKSKYIHIKST